MQPTLLKMVIRFEIFVRNSTSIALSLYLPSLNETRVHISHRKTKFIVLIFSQPTLCQKFPGQCVIGSVALTHILWKMKRDIFISYTLTQNLAQTSLFIISVMTNLYCNTFIPQRLVDAQSHREIERKNSYRYYKKIKLLKSFSWYYPFKRKIGDNITSEYISLLIQKKETPNTNRIVLFLYLVLTRIYL